MPACLTKYDPHAIHSLTFDCPCICHPLLAPQTIRIKITEKPTNTPGVWQAIIVRKPTISAPGLLKLQPSLKFESTNCKFHTTYTWLCEYKDLINA